MDMDENKKNYQLTCLFRPSLGKEELESTVQQIKDWLEKEQGFLSTQKSLQTNFIRQNLSYPIEKQEEAFCWHLDFSLPIQAINKLYEYLALNKNIIRHLITIKKEARVKPGKEVSAPDKIFDLSIIDKIEPMTTAQPLPGQKTSAPSKPKETGPEPKIQEEELDKKLAEILNQ